ncbi:MAG: hypothetical protein AB4368_16920 [Xenococcaceae cyanobacterium]
MKIIQKISFILTLLALSSVGFSSFSSAQVLSNIPLILENYISGEEVILQGKIVGKIEECYIFTDGLNKILIHFKDETLAYNPDIMVEISGTVEKVIMPGMHHFEGGHHGNISMDTMIMVDKFQVISTKK